MNQVLLSGTVHYVTVDERRFWALLVAQDKPGGPAAYVPLVAFCGKDENPAHFSARFQAVVSGAVVEVVGRLTTSQEKDRAGVPVNHPVTHKPFSKMEVYVSSVAPVIGGAEQRAPAGAPAAANKSRSAPPSPASGSAPPPPLEHFYPPPPFAAGR